MTGMPDPRFMEYVVTRTGKVRKLAVMPVAVSLEGLTPDEVQVVGHLSEAAMGITPIFADQAFPDGRAFYTDLVDLEGRIEDPEQRRRLGEYVDILAMKSGSPWDVFSPAGHQFPLTADQIPEGHPAHNYLELLANQLTAPAWRGLYPAGVTEDDVKGLDGAKVTNSTVVRDADGHLKVVLNEERFRRQLGPVASALERARAASQNAELNNYVTAKLAELGWGTESSRTASTLAWIANTTGNVDFSLGTGVEEYLDDVMGARGVAQGGDAGVSGRGLLRDPEFFNRHLTR